MRIRNEKTLAQGKSRQRGLTLIEIMVVILILGLIASAVGTNVFGLFAQSKVDQAKTEIITIKDAIGLYAGKNGGYPETLVELTTPFNYLKNVDKGENPVDPWGRPYEYVVDDNEEDGFIVWSRGEKQDDESDDIRSNEINRGSSRGR